MLNWTDIDSLHGDPSTLEGRAVVKISAKLTILYTGPSIMSQGKIPRGLYSFRWGIVPWKEPSKAVN